MRNVKLVVLLTSIIISSFALAEVTPNKSTYVMCKNGTAVRTIRVVLKGQACRALYTKEGVDQIVGRSGTADVCVSIADKIKSNLEAGNWKCKDISQTRVSSSLE